MKHSILLILIVMSTVVGSESFCDKIGGSSITTNNNSMENNKIKIKVKSEVFTATLLENNSAKAFRQMLPLTIDMTELNSNEKYYDLPKSLPTNPSNPKAIKKGDLMLYGSETLVLFYKNFSTSYSYTKLGAVDNVEGLTSALGSGNVTVSFLE